MEAFCSIIVVVAASAALLLVNSASEAAAQDWSSATLIRVDQSGKGDFKTIQDAVDAVPSNNSAPVIILVKSGIYREKVMIPADKPFITLSGTNAASTVITWNEEWKGDDSPTVSVLAPDFVGRYLTIQNTFGTSAPAIALRVSGDRAAFYACRFIGYQDTLLDDAGRHYYRNCYIEGATDFVCGNALSLFEKCHLHSVSEVGGAYTAQRRGSAEEETGYSFLQCRLTGAGAGTAILGRPWAAYSRVVFSFTYMSSAVQSQGWNNWNDANNERTVFYGQYKCSGPGANETGRVDWSRQLSSFQAAQFVTTDWIGGQDWLRLPPPISADSPP